LRIKLYDKRDEVQFEQDQRTYLDCHTVNLLKQQSAGRHVAPLESINLTLIKPVFVLSH